MFIRLIIFSNLINLNLTYLIFIIGFSDIKLMIANSSLICINSINLLVFKIFWNI